MPARSVALVILSPSLCVILSEAKNLAAAQDKLREESKPLVEMLRCAQHDTVCALAQ